MTDDEIETLVEAHKTVSNPKARWSTQRKSLQKTYHLVLDDSLPRMEIKLRQNTLDPDNFSCVLLCYLDDGEKITLRRYNGSNHEHRNKLEPNEPLISFVCHIHMATQRYIEIGDKSEGYAVKTDEYDDFDGALSLLIGQCNVHGLKKEDGSQLDIFE